MMLLQDLSQYGTNYCIFSGISKIKSHDLKENKEGLAKKFRELIPRLNVVLKSEPFENYLICYKGCPEIYNARMELLDIALGKTIENAYFRFDVLSKKNFTK